MDILCLLLFSCIECVLFRPRVTISTKRMKGERYTYLHRLRTNSSASIGGGTGGSSKSIGREIISVDVTSPCGERTFLFLDFFKMIYNRTFPRSRVHLDSLSRGKVESESFFSYICATLPHLFAARHHIVIWDHG